MPYKLILGSFLLCLSVAGFGQVPPAQQTAESDYLQNRAAVLNDRIEIAIREHKLSRRLAGRLRLTVGRVQTSAGNLQARGGTISRFDADQLNQQLTDVERALPPRR